MGIVGREHWTRKGEGSPTLTKRRERLPEYLATPRRPISVEFIRIVFERDHPGVADPRVVEAYAPRIPVPTLLFHALHAFFSEPPPVYRG